MCAIDAELDDAGCATVDGDGLNGDDVPPVSTPDPPENMRLGELGGPMPVTLLITCPSGVFMPNDWPPLRLICREHEEGQIGAKLFFSILCLKLWTAAGPVE
jgi:hypothetical protein